MNRSLALLSVAAVACVLLLPSCGNGRTQQLAVESDRQRDSLEQVVAAKDSLINAVFADINAISENLARIKSRENLITVSEEEGTRRPVEEINNDIDAIGRLLAENREKINSLRHTAAQLRKANLRIEGLEKMIADLNGQLAERQSEIEQLRDELSLKDTRVAELTETVAEQSAEVEQLSGRNLELENRLNTVYYIVGSEKELCDAQIINKQGFIGRTLTVGEHGSLESFTQADSRLLSEIPVGHRKVTVVTNHPEGSYELVTDADKRVVSLWIVDPVRFWESSKVLIVSYK
ncbi:MAG TPA: hypothetical protein IAA35_09105 [Candidatus Alistipes faecigallinarum]|uniref:Cbp1 family collagen-binding glycoprotein adhesin n=1 Tax=uncultured Alistipes sp. TaxID=538949 RepID=UPI001FA217FA|nr:hypothetical protein [uncultured Alistipes sp.]HIY48166.1 hypothetical protein [Candidatus Alistipes faecigallinarum]